MITRKARGAARRAAAAARFARYRLEADGACLCGETAARTLGSRRVHGRTLRLVECAACGLGRLSPRLADADLGRYYRDDYRRGRAIDEMYFERGVRRGRRIRDLLAAHGLLPPPGSSVVEPGTGAGGILAAFRERGHPVAGSDLDEACVAYARAAGLAVVAGEAVPPGLAPTPAGLVVLSHFVEHLPDPVATLRGLEPWLGPDTLVYVEVPGLRSGVAPAEQIRVPHLFYYDLAALSRVLAETGLELVHGDEAVHAVFRQLTA